uniref:Uncharacterized protein n=1 Tax=Rhizophora mucronata TaxID=61149 RepID=A0A2P2PBF0_RHIMU
MKSASKEIGLQLWSGSPKTANTPSGMDGKF